MTTKASRVPSPGRNAASMSLAELVAASLTLVVLAVGSFVYIKDIGLNRFAVVS